MVVGPDRSKSPSKNPSLRPSKSKAFVLLFVWAAFLFGGIWLVQRGMGLGWVATVVIGVLISDLALAVLDLPVKAGEHETEQEAAAFAMKAASPVIVFHKQIQPAPVSEDKRKSGRCENQTCRRSSCEQRRRGCPPLGAGRSATADGCRSLAATCQVQLWLL